MSKYTTAMQELVAYMKRFNYDVEKYIIEKAEELLEMEREQMVEAYSTGWHDGQDVIIDRVKHVDKGGDDAGEHYFKEMYR